jgi:hypothetical protein
MEHMYGVISLKPSSGRRGVELQKTCACIWLGLRKSLLAWCFCRTMAQGGQLRRADVPVALGL